MKPGEYVKDTHYSPLAKADKISRILAILEQNREFDRMLLTDGLPAENGWRV